MACSGRNLGFLLFCVLTSLSTFPAAADDTNIPPGRSIWTHNDSAVFLVTEGKALKFYYQKPNFRLDGTGAKPGTLLVDALVDGDSYVGTAYIFSKKCGSASYPVQGSGIGDRRIELKGKAPVRNAACKQIDTRDDVLIFDFVFRTEADKSSGPVSSPPFQMSPKVAILKDPKGAMDALTNLEKPANSQVARGIIDGITDGALQVGRCFYNGGFLNDKDNPTSTFLGYFFKIADFYTLTAAELRVLGYPEGVWRPRLLALRDNLIDIIIEGREHNFKEFDYGTLHEKARPFRSLLVNALANYRSQTNPRLLPIEAAEFCGGDFWGNFKVSLIPSDGKVWFIDGLNYTWCTRKGFVPVEEHCDFWVRILPTLSLPFGIYRYRVEWADGTKETDRIEIFDASLDGKTVTIKRQK
jgi:hypothetical protein